MEPLHTSRALFLKPSRGFSLIELLVVLAIIAIVTTIAFSSQSSFNRTLVLASAAYDVALTIRNTETYGLGSRGSTAVSNAGYGIDFQKSANMNSFTLFVDSYPPVLSKTSGSYCQPIPGSPPDTSRPDAKAGNCFYDSSHGEKVSDYVLNNGIKISDFCVKSASTWSCANSHGSTLSSLDLVFARPNPTTFISVNGAYSSILSAACLTLVAPTGGSRFVSVNAAGNIAANAASCP